MKVLIRAMLFTFMAIVMFLLFAVSVQAYTTEGSIDPAVVLTLKPTGVQQGYNLETGQPSVILFFEVEGYDQFMVVLQDGNIPNQIFGYAYMKNGTVYAFLYDKKADNYKMVLKKNTNFSRNDAS